jgi:DNA-directed RNA polymerase specialized sigma24 family protein
VQRSCFRTCLASDVDDIVQETLLGFWQALIDGRLEGLTVDNWKEEFNLDRIGEYLCGIARNVRRAFYRGLQRRKSVDLPADACAPAVSCPVVLSEIQAAIQQCKPAQRETFMLKQHGWSTAEIAEKQAIPDATVRTHLARARGSLKEILKDYE